MLGRVYSVAFNGSAQTAQVDFFEVVSASTKIIELLEVYLSQTTEVGDAQEEGLAVLIKSGQTTTGSGGATGTSVPRQLGDAASGATCKTNNTTKATAGTIVTHETWAWNVRVPFRQVWMPESTIIIPPSGRLTVELGTTPADSITFNGSLLYREIG